MHYWAKLVMICSYTQVNVSVLWLLHQFHITTWDGDIGFTVTSHKRHDVLNSRQFPTFFQLVQDNKRNVKHCITGHLWGESRERRTEGQLCRKRFSAMTSSWLCYWHTYVWGWRYLKTCDIFKNDNYLKEWGDVDYWFETLEKERQICFGKL